MLKDRDVRKAVTVERRTTSKASGGCGVWNERKGDVGKAKWSDRLKASESGYGGTGEHKWAPGAGF